MILFFLIIAVPPATLKKVKIHVETLHTTKSKEEKAATKGGKKKGKGSTVKMDLNKVGVYCLLNSHCLV